jgi:hypothetical protein
VDTGTVCGAAMSVQPQLIHANFVEKDVVYTPDWVARDMVDFFKPSGRVLEPCRGEGAIYRYLPAGSDWCEIQEGRDFFAFNEQVDWIITNPPYSAFGKWILRGMEISKNVVYLAPVAKPFYSEKLFREMQAWGKIKHIRVYGGGSKLDFPIGFLIGAIHFQKGYFGAMETSDARRIVPL